METCVILKNITLLDIS